MMTKNEQLRACIARLDTMPNNSPGREDDLRYIAAALVCVERGELEITREDLFALMRVCELSRTGCLLLLKDEGFRLVGAEPRCVH
jgi:hypothetical protein